MLHFIILLIILIVLCAIAFWLIDNISFPAMPAFVNPLLKLIVVLIGLVVLYNLAASVFHLPAL